jgi:menaquinone-9 beta-reductase
MTTAILSPRPSRSHYDAIVVGARCAGAATAMLLARQGARVLLVDRAKCGSDTVSTHALMRGGVLQLHRWGLLGAVAASGAQPVREVTFAYGEREVPVRIRAEEGVDTLYAPRRTVLDGVLADAAGAAGAELIFGHSLTGLDRDAAGRVVGAALSGPSGTSQVSAGIVVGADGVRSTVAELVGAETYQAGRNATAVIYGYFPGLANRGYRWMFVPGATAGAIPTNDGEHCVFVGVPAERRAEAFAGEAEAAFRRVLARAAPDLAQEIETADARLRTFGGIRAHLRQPFGPGWALVGDVGYFKDPCTAHGITDAFRDAELLARAIIGGRRAGFEDYQGLRDALSLPLMQVTDAIAGCDWTLDEVAELHAALNQAMKTEVAVMARLAPLDAAVPRRAA